MRKGHRGAIEDERGAALVDHIVEVQMGSQQHGSLGLLLLFLLDCAAWTHFAFAVVVVVVVMVVTALSMPTALQPLRIFPHTFVMPSLNFNLLFSCVILLFSGRLSMMVVVMMVMVMLVMVMACCLFFVNTVGWTKPGISLFLVSTAR